MPVPTSVMATILFNRKLTGYERYCVYAGVADRYADSDADKAINALLRVSFLIHFCGHKPSKAQVERLEWAKESGINLSADRAAEFVYRFGLGGMHPQCCMPWPPRYDVYADVWAQRFIAARYHWATPEYPPEPDDLPAFMGRIETAVNDAARSEAPIRPAAIVDQPTPPTAPDTDDHPI